MPLPPLTMQCQLFHVSCFVLLSSPLALPCSISCPHAPGGSPNVTICASGPALTCVCHGATGLVIPAKQSSFIPQTSPPAHRGFVPAGVDPILHASTYESNAAVLQLRPDMAGEPARMLVKIGYKAQSSAVVSHLETLVAMWHAAGRSAIVEGVHLHLKAVMRLMQKYPSILPFLVRPPLRPWLF